MTNHNWSYILVFCMFRITYVSATLVIDRKLQSSLLYYLKLITYINNISHNFFYFHYFFFLNSNNSLIYHLLFTFYLSYHSSTFHHLLKNNVKILRKLIISLTCLLIEIYWISKFLVHYFMFFICHDWLSSDLLHCECTNK